LDATDDRARRELVYLLGDTAGTRVGDIYAAAVRQSRFRDAIVSVVARGGIVLDQTTQLAVYGVVRATRDTRSTGGAQPVIYSDNFAIAGAGVRTRPFQSALAMYAEGGLAVDLVRPAERRSPQLDVRGGAYYSRAWTDWVSAASGDFVNDVYVDASYYSRYSNTIMYAMARPGVRVARSDELALDAVTRAFVAADSRRAFYNNVGEAGVGARLMTPPSRGIAAYVEYVWGRYLGSSGPYARGYHDVRISLVYGGYGRW
jgi:hypothetical protein